MEYSKLRNYRHADPSKVRDVWDTLNLSRVQRLIVPTDKLVKSLRKKLGLKDDQIRLLLDEIEGDGLIHKVDPPHGKSGHGGYRLPDFSKPCPRSKHDWYCFQCHKPGEVLRCIDCFRVYHPECAQEAPRLSSPTGNSLRSPLQDCFADDFTCPVCESRPKCEFSRKQIRKLLEFATHHLRKQPLWKTFLQVGYPGEINKTEYLVHRYTDLELLQRKIKDGRYAALEEFSMDVQLLVHDVCLLYGPYSNQADEVRFFLRSINNELSEIQLCTDCYINAKTRLTEWISKPCKPPHELIWARDRTAVGAGFFNGLAISQYYWPAKILLERDDGYEIRFFGGTHERMLVKKSNTHPFHKPADEVGVLRRSNLSGNVSNGGFERAWNEVSKLQANIDSGYYTHSSGESDFPASDEEYSDELYLGPRRGTINHYQGSTRTNSPHSSLASSNTKKVKQRRQNSSASRNSSASDTDDSSTAFQTISPVRANNTMPVKVSKLSTSTTTTSNDRNKISPRLPMPVAQPGTPGAAAISALAETKAAMAAAVGSSGQYSSGLLSLTSKMNNSNNTRKDQPSITTRGRRGRGRPPKSFSLTRTTLRRKSSSSLSASPSSNRSCSISSGSLSDTENDVGVVQKSSGSEKSTKNWRKKREFSPEWKPNRQRNLSRKPRGRPSLSNGQPKPSCGTAPIGSSDGEGDSFWNKTTRPPNRKMLSTRGKLSSRPKTEPFTKLTKASSKRIASPTKDSIDGTFSGTTKKARGTSKDASSLNRSSDRKDDDDESTDRCCSPVGIDPRTSEHNTSHHHGNKHNLLSPFALDIKLSPDRKLNLVGVPETKTSSSKRTTNITKRRSSKSSNFSSDSSGSTSDAESCNDSTNRCRSFAMRCTEEDKRFRSPTRSGTKEFKNSNTMLRRPPFAPPLSNSSSLVFGASDRNCTTSISNSLHSHGSPHRNFQEAINPTGGSTAGVMAIAAGFIGSNHPSASALGQIESTFSSSHSASNVMHTGSGTPGMSALPRSHLPPNKRAAAAAAAAAMGGGSGSGTESANHLTQRTSPRHEIFPTSPRKLAHKVSQTPFSVDVHQPCTVCRDREKEKESIVAAHERALRALEDELTARFKQERLVAVEQAQLASREQLEREQKIAQERLEAAEVRFKEVLDQTKRRQWCRNCLAEAIYHCCWNTAYCSIQCQQEHWQKEHKRQCKRKR